MLNLTDIYLEETRELLDQIQTSLLQLETEPDNQELIDCVFRAMHNMKGNGAMFGFEEISSFTHDIETVYDKVRNKEIKISNELIDLTLAACDLINLMLIKSGGNNGQHKENVSSILRQFAEFSSPINDKNKAVIIQPKLEKSESDYNKVTSDVEVTYYVGFKPDPNIFSTGTNPILLFDELRELGTCYIVANNDKIPELESFDPERCFMRWDIILFTSQKINAIKDVFIFVEDNCDLKIEVIDSEGILNSDDSKSLSETLIEKGKLTKRDINKLVKIRTSEKDLPEVPKINKSEDAQSSAIEDQGNNKQTTRKMEAEQAVSNIRVSSEKLDNLINLVGEMVTLQANLSQKVMATNDPDLILIGEDVERLTRELREIAMEIRLVPVATLFNKFKRLVRDLSGDLDKEIKLLLDGTDTELDKTVIERLNDPLVHLIRNSIDHGIESLEDREKSGKDSEGSIQISAKQSGADVLITIKDDGRGIDPEKIRAKAVEKGVIESGTDLTDQEIFQLIFMPGFSTTENVSNISGRGVGMDVVRQNIEALRGSIDIKSQKGKGTTITLKIPLTLGIIEGLLVKIAADNYVVPLSVVDDCMEFKLASNNNSARKILDVRGEIVPYIRLREQYKILENPPLFEHIVITSVNEQKTGFVVDEIIGKHQIVIKTLGKMYKNVEGLSGATILGDGSVALILDVPKLVQIAEAEEAELRV